MDAATLDMLERTAALLTQAFQRISCFTRESDAELVRQLIAVRAELMRAILSQRNP